MGDKRFDSWQGFIDAGFKPTGKNALRQGEGDVFCEVTRKGTGLKVHFETGAKTFGNVDFDFPRETEDFWQWAALFACGAIGSRSRWEQLQRRIGKTMPKDLADVMKTGINHLDELPIEKRQIVGDEMAAAIGVIRKRLEATVDGFQEEQLIAGRHGNLDKVNALAGKICRVKELLGALIEIGALVAAERPAPDPRPIVLPTQPTGPKTKRTNFAVAFDDGVRIAEDTAGKTFALAIEKMGAGEVAELGLQFEGDPIVAKDRAEIKKSPSGVLPIAGGEWFVKTHSSTQEKMKKIKQSAEALHFGLAFEWFYCQGVNKPQGLKRKPPVLTPKPAPVTPSLFDGLGV